MTCKKLKSFYFYKFYETCKPDGYVKMTCRKTCLAIKKLYDEAPPPTTATPTASPTTTSPTAFPTTATPPAFQTTATLTAFPTIAAPTAEKCTGTDACTDSNGIQVQGRVVYLNPSFKVFNSWIQFRMILIHIDCVG